MTDWVDELPPNRQGHTEGKYADLIADLKANPGRWALMRRGPAATVTQVRLGRIKGFTVGEFEVTSRNHDKTINRADIYVRYIGPAKELT